MKIEIKKLFKTAVPSDKNGWITNYKDGDSLDNYYASKIIYTALNYDIESDFREISNEKHEQLQQEKLKH